jgi:hypothetical protein
MISSLIHRTGFKICQEETGGRRKRETYLRGIRAACLDEGDDLGTRQRIGILALGGIESGNEGTHLPRLKMSRVVCGVRTRYMVLMPGFCSMCFPS